LDERNKRRGRILNVLKVIVSLAGLAWVISKLDLGETWQELTQMNLLMFATAMSLYMAGVLVRAYRWGILVWSLGVQVSWWRLVELYFVGTFFSQVLPTGVGGDAIRMYELARDNPAAAAINSVLVDRFLGLFTLFGMALIPLAVDYSLVSAPVRAVIITVFAVSLLLVVLVLQRTWMERWGRRLRLDRLFGRIKILRELYASVQCYSKRALLKATGVSVVFNLMHIMIYYLLGLAVGITLPVWMYFLIVPIISALLLIPAVGGLGVREGGTVALFVQAGATPAQAGALAAAFLAGVFLTGLVGAILYIVGNVREART
jgi:hypothetical protein